MKFDHQFLHIKYGLAAHPRILILGKFYEEEKNNKHYFMFN